MNEIAQPVVEVFQSFVIIGGIIIAVMLFSAWLASVVGEIFD